MPSSAEVRQAYRQLLATLQEIDERYLGEDRHITSADDVAEGHRLVFHVLQSAVDLFLESDPDRPRFKRLLSPSRKHTGDNPDVVYYHALIGPDHDLVIRGRRAGETYLSFTVYGSSSGVWSDNISAEINHNEMCFAEDGSYEILLSRNRPDRCSNWLPLAMDSFQVVSRHYYETPTPEGAALFPDARPLLSRLEPGPPLPRQDAAVILESMKKMDRYLRLMTLEKMNVGSAAMPEWFSRVPNTIGPPRLWEQGGDGGGNGTGYIAYAAGFFQLQPGQALVIEGRMPACQHGGVVLTNRFLQSLDYRERRICRNRSNMTLAADGGFRVVVAAEDPGVENWLDTEGRASGVVYWRFMLPAGEIAPMTSKVVAVDALRMETTA